jgi:two-component system, NarL family, response regulator YdfI
MIRILLFAVDAKLRRALEQLPKKDSSIAIVGSANNQQSLVRLSDSSAADVVLTQEVPRPEQLRDWRVRHNDTEWVLFLAPKSGLTGLEALRAGASAILPPYANLAEIVATIRMVAAGLAVIPQRLVAELSGGPEIVSGRSTETDDDRPRLSKREMAVLTAMADGLSNKEIARRLGISFHTVKFHVASILEKLEVDTRTEAIVKAVQLGMVML